VLKILQPSAAHGTLQSVAGGLSLVGTSRPRDIKPSIETGKMQAASSSRPDVMPGYRAAAEREIRAFTRAWTKRDDRIAALSYGGTFAVYFLTLALAVQAWPIWWLVLPLILINALAGVRLYVLQHDCGHGSLFSTKARNDRAGHGLSIFTLTPYRVMQSNHNDHHSHLGNLDERDTTEIFTMTLREWEQAGFWRRPLVSALPQPVDPHPRLAGFSPMSSPIAGPRMQAASTHGA
jgi:hypothetical protein